jgi:hypothetical protein
MEELVSVEVMQPVVVIENGIPEEGYDTGQEVILVMIDGITGEGRECLKSI